MLRDLEDLMNEDFRKSVLKEIDGPENLARKNDELRKHEVYRDKTGKWVLLALSKEGLKNETLAQMSNRLANLSVCRRIINKLARNYIVPPKRTAKRSQKAVDEWGDELDLNTQMKKVDRYLQLFKNTVAMVLPVKDSRASSVSVLPIYRLKMRVLPAWAYDVLPDPNDPTKIGCLILSEFTQRASASDSTSDYRGSLGYHQSARLNSSDIGDGIEQAIADAPADTQSDEKNRRFIWWSDKYHFTTDKNGKVIASDSPDGLLNPIGIGPYVNFCGDQDNYFWAEGGDDVVDSSILLDKILTDINFISFVQGWGQMVITGKDIPKNIEGGPGKAFVLPQKSSDDPTPTVYFASSNPPISQWLETFKTTLALLLSTNGLSVRNISATLDATDFPSGVAMLIEQSEVVEFNQDTQMLFQDKEPEIWALIESWRKLYSMTKQLVEEQAMLREIKDTDVNLNFVSLKPPISEGELLDNLKKRKELGLASLEDLLRLDNPDLTDEEIAEKAAKLDEEKQKNIEKFGPGLSRSGSGADGEDEQDDEDGDEASKEKKQVPAAPMNGENS